MRNTSGNEVAHGNKGEVHVMAWNVQLLVPGLERKEHMQQPVHRFIFAWSRKGGIRRILEQSGICIQKATTAPLVFCWCRRPPQSRVVRKDAFYIRCAAGDATWLRLRITRFCWPA
ncbi:hypothetical protein CR918_18800 [Stenotrophomonas indicatrix]|nr:hypothetical protein CR918_18800 [Stenotrophomonas indicatrix]PJL08867.1 hypothetical protein B9Y68_18875 [Stenotrophomonas maltophilia]PJL19113.1 hypothetical protein B9Y72_18875 [Stenotrophomonas maltophilia]